MSRRRTVTSEEARLWRTVVRDAMPLPGRPSLDAARADEPPVPTPAPTKTAMALVIRAVDPPTPRPAPRELAHGATPGVDRRTADRLRRGRMVIDGSLDLHGMTQEAAHGALTGYLGRAQAQGRRCVLVITGKGNRDSGTGVLKRMVPLWLNEERLRPLVLGFSYARPHHGGEGALYVLLKRHR